MPAALLLQSQRNMKSAKRIFRKLPKGLRYTLCVVVTDKLKSYAPAKKELKLGGEHPQSRYLNNTCEASLQSTRCRERHMKKFKSARHAQRSLSTRSPIHNRFQLRRHRLSVSRIPRRPGSRLDHMASGGRSCAGRLSGTGSRLPRPVSYQPAAKLTAPWFPTPRLLDV
ncbi:DDE-type integrase/transposase/recombinase [Azospirillum endophyticum]